MSVVLKQLSFRDDAPPSGAGDHGDKHPETVEGVGCTPVVVSD